MVFGVSRPKRPSVVEIEDVREARKERAGDGFRLRRDTLDRVRAFIKARTTVYLSTHCPEGYESLELKRVLKFA